MLLGTRMCNLVTAATPQTHTSIYPGYHVSPATLYIPFHYYYHNMVGRDSSVGTTRYELDGPETESR